MYKHFVIFLLILVSSAVNLNSAINDNAGTTSANFLKILSSARSDGMASAFIAVADDVNSLYFNPAGLTGVKRKEIQTTYSAWFENSSFGLLDYGMPLAKNNCLGIGLGYFSYGEMAKTSLIDAAGIPVQDGTFNAWDFNVLLGYAQSLYRDNDTKWLYGLAYGINAKIITRSIDSSTIATAAIDIGVLYTPLKFLNIGFAVQNIGPGLKYENYSDNLPLNIRLGLAQTVIFNPIHKLICAIDISQPVDNNTRFLAGVEYAYKNILFFRTGLRYNYDTNWFTTGIGVRYGHYRLDYAYLPFGPLGNAHKLTLVFTGFPRSR
ncbi:MAG: PorV/PorQ family protein [Elusimicrobiota bacterium]